MSNVRPVGFVSGLVWLLVCVVLSPPPGLAVEGLRMAGVAGLMAIWWMTEAIPIAVTALLPLVLYPCFGILPSKAVGQNYGNHLIFLFLGGFMLAIAMEKCNLHRRIALNIISLFGASPRKLLLGFMVATAFLSMWISNTATTMMMLPIAMAVVMQLDQHRNSGMSKNREQTGDKKGGESPFGMTLMLGIAYSASIGGIGTLIGTPPNIVFAGFLNKLFPQSPEIGFVQWMAVGIPLVMIMLPITWMILAYWGGGAHLNNIKNGDEQNVIRGELARMGRMSVAEKRVMAVFTVTALLWIFRSPIDLGFLRIPGWSLWFGHPKFLHDATVAMGMSTLMFLIPAVTRDAWKGTSREKLFLLDWKTVEKGVPWGILLLFGGGFALAAGFQHTGLAKWIGEQLAALHYMPLIVMILSIALLITFLTEMTSNTAVTTMMMPILAGSALGMSVHPFLLMIPATLSASCAFMLPVATPPNAIVFGSGWLTIPRMAKTGVVLNLIGALIITLLCYTVVVIVFSINLHQLPAWAH